MRNPEEEELGIGGCGDLKRGRSGDINAALCAGWLLLPDVQQIAGIGPRLGVPH